MVNEAVRVVVTPELSFAVTWSVYRVSGLSESVACQPPPPSARPARCCPSAATSFAELTAPFVTVTTTGVSGRTPCVPSAGATEIPARRALLVDADVAATGRAAHGAVDRRVARAPRGRTEGDDDRHRPATRTHCRSPPDAEVSP